MDLGDAMCLSNERLTRSKYGPGRKGDEGCKYGEGNVPDERGGTVTYKRNFTPISG